MTTVLAFKIPKLRKMLARKTAAAPATAAKVHLESSRSLRYNGSSTLFDVSLIHIVFETTFQQSTKTFSHKQIYTTGKKK